MEEDISPSFIVVRSLFLKVFCGNWVFIEEGQQDERPIGGDREIF